MSSLHILSGGAAQGLVQQLRGNFYNETGRAIEGHFGAVGLMRDKLLAGEPCDVLILTEPLIDELTVAGRVQPGSARPLGRVRTGLAVKAGEPQPRVDTPEALKAALLAAQGIYCPDPHKATAGVHFMGVLKRLGVAQALEPVLRSWPNGAAAMRELAAASGSGLIGCAQVAEIRYTPGVQLVGALPKEFELATVYAAAIASRAEQPQAARLLIDMLAAPDTAPLRRAGGFE
ncbi:MAG: substrate-binding domain-containing protein [Hylemonella sp.]|uniref:molybdate ABC transporter substrate-binding protein n=1 Tax=Hylemonella sp. TaxID=2066020 RepID=UPI0022BB1781|nr:substrate-binding domain-containing protein [Hylemonella sp.]MCZ8253231.1 substrate-binding domain-containing protein [Hylemonella sp.]